jgi:predicted dehydrogenase
MKRLRIGIIGYGLRGRILANACKGFSEIEVAAICDRGMTTRERAIAEFPEAKTFTDHLSMYRKGNIDAVMVETPPETHAACSIAALERGIHVLSDVPAVHAVSEAPRLWEAARKSKAVYMMGATTNYWAFVDAGRDILSKGLLGKPFYCEADYVADLGEMTRQTPWRKYYEPIRYCTHSLGPILHWIDEDLRFVACFDGGSHAHGDRKEHDAMVAIFRTRSRVLVKLVTSFINAHPVPFHRYLMQGTQGYFERTQPLADGAQKVLLSTREVYGMSGMNVLPVAESRPEVQAGIGEHGGADFLMIRDFMASINGAPVTIDMRKALRMSLPGLFALESAKRGGELVTIQYPWDRIQTKRKPSRGGKKN